MARKTMLFLAICAGLLLMSCSNGNPAGAGNSAPTITTQPASQSVNEGSSVSLSVVATGDPAPTYQWQKDGVDIAGATSATYTIASATGANSGSYRVIATNSEGSDTSNTATLAVNPTTPTAPVIVTQPQPVTVVDGGSATFTVVATGNPAPGYQWLKNGTNITGATSATYTIAAVTLTDAATYSVLVSSSQGSDTSSGALLTVNRGPEVMTYTVTNDTMHLVSALRIEPRTECNGDTLVTEYDTTSDGGTMDMKFSVSGNTLSLYLDTVPTTLSRVGSGSGLVGTWTPDDATAHMPDTLAFTATTLTVSGGGDDNRCYADDYMEWSWPNDSANFNGTAVKLSCTQIRLTGAATSEQVTITWDAVGNKTFTSTNAARTPHIWYENPTSCPNNWSPDWYYSTDGFWTLNQK